jgi:predicted metal-dependent phosphoesterase TrpH
VIVDFHVHTCGSHDSGMDPRLVLLRARQVGLDGMAVCDHDTVDAALELAAEAARAARTPGPKAGRPGPHRTSDPAGFLVIVGEEIRTAEGEIIGYFLHETIPPGLTPEATIDRIREQGGIVCVPHPFDRFRRSPLSRAALGRIADRVDAIEGLNARNLLFADDAKARRWALERGVPVLAGSDAHTYREIGLARTQLPTFFSAASLLDALPHACLLGGHSGPAVHVATALRKRRNARRPIP